tara:strand:+ start:322 stop:822 length:501 start_codon:yes stop_codon:yes gene_type:complete
MPRKTSKVQHSMGKDSDKTYKKESSEEDVLDPIEESVPSMTMSSFGNLRDLIFLGRLETSVNIENFSFKLSTLSSAQQKEVVKVLMSFDDNQRLANVRDYTVAQALVSVNGVPLEELCESEDRASLADKVDALGNLQNSILDKLFVEYNKLSEETRESEAEEDLKK